MGPMTRSRAIDPETAETALKGGIADLVAFGRSFLANPDLDKRIALKAPLINRTSPPCIHQAPRDI